MLLHGSSRCAVRTEEVLRVVLWLGNRAATFHTPQPTERTEDGRLPRAVVTCTPARHELKNNRADTNLRWLDLPCPFVCHLCIHPPVHGRVLSLYDCLLTDEE